MTTNESWLFRYLWKALSIDEGCIIVVEIAALKPSIDRFPGATDAPSANVCQSGFEFGTQPRSVARQEKRPGHIAVARFDQAGDRGRYRQTPSCTPASSRSRLPSWRDYRRRRGSLHKPSKRLRTCCALADGIAKCARRPMRSEIPASTAAPAPCQESRRAPAHWPNENHRSQQRKLSKPRKHKRTDTRAWSTLDR